jgi:antitoxin component YwqK of YwqJK toxin-antitoxin module
MAIILLSAACGGEPNDAGLYGNVESVKEYTAGFSVENGKEMIGEKELQSETIYDERGREVELKDFDAGGRLARRTVSAYTEFDDPVKQTTYDKSGEITWEVEFTLNEQGNPVVVTWHDLISDETYKRIFTLSPDGSQILSSHAEMVPDGKPAGEGEYDVS